MRSRILPTLALLGSVFSYEAASAQPVQQATYATKATIPAALAIDNTGLTKLLANSADTKLFVSSLAQGCTEFPDGSCRRFSPSDYQLGLERNANNISVIEVNPLSTPPTVIYHKVNGKKNVIEVPSTNTLAEISRIY